MLGPASGVSNYLQSWTKLLEKVFPIMSTFLCNKTISKTTPLRKENPFPQFNVASHKRPGIRLSFEYTTTLLSGGGGGGEGRTGTATMFRKMLSKYTIFSTVLSKIVALEKIYCMLILQIHVIWPSELSGHKTIISQRGGGVIDTPGPPATSYAPD